ncbi:tRNA-splicing endonuclease subunit Sen54 [Topomyia yanbarensis]|uniref:tRNA-splicing endonuclease subunit Sen54 n=1 Tax=Topomyia yanbarensis TaxID=2498891 RepID=UPI00273C2FA3|nr:tRNA-splicing endonuclease subunit Sen54 [Topomyia yanbarensis]
MSDSKMNKQFQNPKALLSGRDMLEHHLGNYDLKTRLDRFVLPEDEIQHQEYISQMKGELYLMLAQQRVGKAETYSTGEWMTDRRRVKITKAVGKWNIFGYIEDHSRFLEGYEALHLMELNRLIVYWNSVVVSVEQAYSIFLGYTGSLSLEEYQVYNTMMRAGFYLLKCDSNRTYETVQVKELDVEERCIWSNLYDMLNQPNLLMPEGLAIMITLHVQCAHLTNSTMTANFVN